MKPKIFFFIINFRNRKLVTNKLVINFSINLDTLGEAIFFNLFRITLIISFTFGKIICYLYRWHNILAKTNWSLNLLPILDSRFFETLNIVNFFTNLNHIVVFFKVLVCYENLLWAFWIIENLKLIKHMLFMIILIKAFYFQSLSQKNFLKTIILMLTISSFHFSNILVRKVTK